MQIRVLLADDHAMVRTGIGAVLKELSNVTIIAEAGDGQEAIELIKQHQPDVAIVDVAMPKLNGIEVAVRRFNPGDPLVLGSPIATCRVGWSLVRGRGQ